LLERIEREIGLHSEADPGHMLFKMNALEDVDVVNALYRASMAGVRVDLIVRDSCRARPGIPGISETLKVISIVDRFLEHARIYYFRNGGEEEYFIGSADAMKRNLEHRVEVLVPVESSRVRQMIREMLDVQWNDRRSAWELQNNGSYVQRQPGDEAEARSSQQLLMEQAEKRLKEVTRLRKRKARNFGNRNLRE